MPGRKIDPDDHLIAANKQLSQRRYGQAIKTYTKVLYEYSPASIIALLNRSLAYTCKKLPELAAFDAYRACILADQMKSDENHGLDKYQAATKYLRREQLHVGAREQWTHDKRRFITGGWAQCPLAAILINDIPINWSGNPMPQPFNIKRRQIVCLALGVRALYRLCGALYLCGGGAWSDAIGLIEDANIRCEEIEEWEWTYFEGLGKLVLKDTLQPWDDDSSILKGLSQIAREKVQQKHKDIMKAKTASLRLTGYKHDIYEPDLDSPGWKKLLLDWVQIRTDNCKPHYVQPDDILDEMTATYAELRADRDISAGEIVLSESSAANVCTRTPEDMLDMKNNEEDTDLQWYCDACATLLIANSKCKFHNQGSKVPQYAPKLSPSPPSVSQQPSLANDSTSCSSGLLSSSNSSAAGSNSSAAPTGSGKSVRKNNEDISNHSVSGSDSSTGPKGSGTASDGNSGYIKEFERLSCQPVPPIGRPSDLMFCCLTHHVATCSNACRAAREVFDPCLCHTKIEEKLRKSHFKPKLPATTSLEARKRQCLIDLLFLRIYTKAFVSNSHPLQDSEIIFAGCSPSHQGKINVKRDWSFMTHVVRPIQYIDKIMQQAGGDQFDHFDRCDGWMINTMLTKIELALRVSSRPHYAKVFNGRAMLDYTLTPYDENLQDLVHEILPIVDQEKGTPSKDDEPWIGSLHTMFNLIRVADPTKGETPNVVVVQREEMKVYAFSGLGIEPAIKKGEPLLRAADDDTRREDEDAVGMGEEMRALVQGTGEGVKGGGDMEWTGSGKGKGKIVGGGDGIYEDERDGFAEDQEGTETGGQDGGDSDKENMDVGEG
ncbi:hypothetical protein ACLMJK_005725 [Lecanora helva]